MEMQITLSRDSVCMGDDMVDHSKTIHINPQRKHSIIMDIAEKYLPWIAGTGHSWDCLLDGRKIAQGRWQLRKNHATCGICFFF